MGLPSTLLSRRTALPILIICLLALLFVSLPSTSTSPLPSAPKWAQLSKAPSSSSASRWSWSRHSNAQEVTAPRDDYYSQGDEDLGDALQYRKHLELTTSPSGYSHSPTLGFNHIYCLTLASRHDRRARMERLALALGLQLTFVDATPPTAPVLRWIAERVREVREMKVKILTSKRMQAKKVGGGGVTSPWLLGREELRASAMKEARWGNRDWVTYLEEEEGRSTVLDSEDSQFDIARALYDVRAQPSEQVGPATLATWHSHVLLLKLMKMNGDRDALVLEDDVDFEWDLQRLWATAARRLPKVGSSSLSAFPGSSLTSNFSQDYDAVWLGHCWGREMHKPAYLHPLLHEATQPRCLHAYAISRIGASTLHARLSDPWLAYQGPIDVAVASLVTRDALRAFSIHPSLIIQSKSLSSDVLPAAGKGRGKEAGGSGNEWGGWLMDSTEERVLRDSGEMVPEPVFDPLDPAVNYRGGRAAPRPFKPKSSSDDPLPATGHHSNPSLLNAEVDSTELDHDHLDDDSLDTSTAAQPLIAIAHPVGEPANGFHPAHPASGDELGEFEEEEAATERPVEPKKVGTGGKLGNIVGKKKKVVKRPPAVGEEKKGEAAKEGGKRVGTGARPGAMMGGGV